MFLSQVTVVQHTIRQEFGKLKDDVTQNMMDSQAALGEVRQASRKVEQVCINTSYVKAKERN